MASITWNGASGDWTDAADWSGGVAPGAGDTAVFTGAGAYTVTLYSTAPVGGVTMNAPNALFYDAGLLTLGGVFALQAGTLDLAYGTLQGGTLALDGGVFQASGGTLDATAVQGTLSMTQADASLIVQGGLSMAGAGGTGTGTLAVTGSYANLDFLGTQILANAVVNLGAGSGQGEGGPGGLSVTHGFGATAGATLTLAAGDWVREAGISGQIIVGAGLPGPLTDEVINQGTITDATAGGTLTLGGPGLFANAGTIGVSNGATLDIASGGFSNTGSIVVSNAVLDLGGTFAAARLSGLGRLSLSAATVEIGGDAVNTGGSVTVGAGTPLGPLLLAGTITGGTLVDQGGGLNLSAGTGLLDDVSYQGSLALGQGSVLTLADDTTLSDAGGAGTASITGAGAALLLDGMTAPMTTLDNATLTLGSNSGTAGLGTTDAWLASAATTAVLGPHLLVQQGGKYAAIDANATTPIQGYGLSDTLENQGSITANFAGGTLTLGGAGTIINQGSIAVSNADTLVIGALEFANTGTIAVSGGATAILGGPPDPFGQSPAWSNTGLISLTNATLELSGTVQTGQIGRIASSGGTIIMAGTLANAGTTLTLGTGGILPGMSLTGTILGGSIADAGGLLSVGAGGTALLDGVTDTGTLNLTQAGAWLRIRDGLTLSGVAEVEGAGAVLGFQGVQTFDKAQILLGASGQAATLDVLHDPSLNGGSTLTLGPNLTVTQAGGLADIGAASDYAGDGIVSYATLTAGIAGGTLVLGGSAFTNHGRIAVSNGDTLRLSTGNFSNSGTISVTNAALVIADAIALSALGTLVLTNAAIAVSGSLNVSGGTLAIGAGSPFGRLSLSGTITGGVIADSGGGLNAAGGATLNGVTYEGVLDLSRPFQQLAITNGITVTGQGGSGAGTIMLTGAASKLLAQTSESITGGTIYLGSATQQYYGQTVAPPELAATAGATLTLGASETLRSAGLVGWLGNFATGNWTDTVVNDGTILAANAGGILTLGSSFFTNAGSIPIGNGGNIMFAGVGMTNSGGISLNAGSALMLSLLAYYEAPDAGATVFTNTGTIHMFGGVLEELTGNGLFPSVALVNQAGGLIQGLGNLLAPVVNNGVIEGKSGPNLSVTGAISGTGTLQVDQGCVLELGNSVSSSQTVRFTGTTETLRIDDPQGFAAHVANFASGDALDIAGTPLNTVAISNGTLVLGTGYGVLKLNTTAPLGGEVSVGADTHGGDLVNYVQQSGGGGQGGGTITTIAVNEPKMLFWASPVGDIFTGSAANMQGATIANWTTADSLDFVDYLGSKTRVSYAQANGQGTITVTDGTHTDTIGLVGSYNASWFHVTTDLHGGALVTYSQS
jgi:hypothetical protein